MTPLTRRQKLTYSLGMFAWASKDVSFHYFLFFYYVQFQGLSASLAGLAAAEQELIASFMARLIGFIR